MATNAGLNRTEALISVEKLKSRFLFGVDLTDDDGNEIPQDTLEAAIMAAVDILETDLDITITPTTYTERRDYIREDYMNWAYMLLYHFPVISVTSVKAKFPNNADFITFPDDWVVLYKEIGELRLVPVSGSIQSYNIGNAGFLPHMFHWTEVPQFFEFIYVAGFANDAIPVLLNQIIGKLASIEIFHITGDLIAGAGIASYSVGLDGLSQSIGTTSSATNAGYGARIINYLKDIDRGVKLLRRYYKGIQTTVT